MSGKKSEVQVISKDRVEKHGEVLTAQKEVKAMIDLVGSVSQDPQSRFLEPACGDGNFLIEVLNRKLGTLKERYGKKKTQSVYEMHSLIAISSLYGVDIQEDNVQKCRLRLAQEAEKVYKDIFKKSASDFYFEAICAILEKNIVCGNALSMKMVDQNANDTVQALVLTQWTPVGKLLLKRQEFCYEHLVKVGNPKAKIPSEMVVSESGEKCFSPIPGKEYPPVSIYDLAKTMKKEKEENHD